MLNVIGNMGLSYIFYKELPVDDDNIFSANLPEDNEIEDVSLKKDNYMKKSTWLLGCL